MGLKDGTEGWCRVQLKAAEYSYRLPIIIPDDWISLCHHPSIRAPLGPPSPPPCPPPIPPHPPPNPPRAARLQLCMIVYTYYRAPLLTELGEVPSFRPLKTKTGLRSERVCESNRIERQTVGHLWIPQMPRMMIPSLFAP